MPGIFSFELLSLRPLKENIPRNILNLNHVLQENVTHSHMVHVSQVQ